MSLAAVPDAPAHLVEHTTKGDRIVSRCEDCNWHGLFVTWPSAHLAAEVHQRDALNARRGTTQLALFDA